MMKKFILIIAALFLSCSVGWAAPSSLSCSGSYAKGGTVNCSFSDGGTAATYFDNLTQTCTGSGCPSTATVDTGFSRTGYYVTGNTDNCCNTPIYSSDQQRGGINTLKGFFTDSNTTNRYGSGYGYNGFPSTPSSVSFSYWIYINDQNSSGHKWDGQLKTWRVQNNLTSVSDAYLGVYNAQTYWVGDSACTGAINDNYINIGWTGSTYIATYDVTSNNKYIFREGWRYIEVFYQPQTSEGNGVFEYTIYNQSVAPAVYRSSTTETTTGSIISIAIENFLGYNTGANPCTDLDAGYGLKANVKVYTADLVIKSNRSAIVLADSSTWSARTHIEQQVPTSRDTTSASFPLNWGSFTTGTTVYLYIVDDSGNANTDGYAITLGSEVIQHTLTVTKSGTGTGTVASSPSGIDCGSTCEYDFDENSTPSLTATPDSGSEFVGWTGDCSGSGNGQPYMSGDKTCNAQFDLIDTSTRFFPMIR